MSALNSEAKLKTPHLDLLAREGMVFTDAHAADTVCTPSRYALLTGRYCWRTSLKRGVLGAEGDCLIAAGRTTLASLLKDAGYRTAMVGKWHLGLRFHGTKGSRDWSEPVQDGPTDRGFDYFYGIPASMNYGILTFIENRRILDPPTLWTTKKPNRIALADYRITPPYSNERANLDLEVAPSFDDQKVLEVLTDRAVRWIDEFAASAGAAERFFLYVAYTSPHKPVVPAPQFRGRSQAGAYGDFMVETDHRVGELLAALERNGLERDTLVVFTSDNGPETTYRERLRRYGHASSGGLRGGKRDIYEGGHRVPFIVRWPAAVSPGGQCAAPVNQTDLLATFAELAGQPLGPGEGEDSFSFLALLHGRSRPARPPMVHHSASGHFAVRDGRWKLNMLRGSGGSLAPRLLDPEPGEPEFELYDLSEDRGERFNLASQHPDIVAKLSATLTAIVRDGHSVAGRASRNDGPDWWPQLTWIAREPAPEP